MSTVRVGYLLIVTVLSSLSVLVGWVITQDGAPPEQQRLLKQLLSKSPEERNLAVNVLMDTPALAGPELRRVLLDLLADSNRLRRESKRRGVAASELQDPLFAANIHHAITGLRDPQAIPLLAEAMGWFTAVRALADFGEQAVPSVLGVISAPDADHYAVEDGLRVLRLIVENKEKTPISAASRAAIVQVAGENLKGGPHFATLWYAIDLAAVLKDPELDRELKVLATDQKAVMGRGVDDPKLMAETMKRAADRLAGVPANPRP